MSRQRLILHNGVWHDVTDWKPPPRKTPYLIRDSMDALRHPATGQMLDSKSAFRRITRDRGMVEVGNDQPIAPRQMVEPDPGPAIDRALKKLDEGYRPAPLPEAAPDTRIY